MSELGGVTTSSLAQVANYQAQNEPAVPSSFLSAAIIGARLPAVHAYTATASVRHKHRHDHGAKYLSTDTSQNSFAQP